MQMSEFKRRRRELMRMMGPGSIAILPTAPLLIRNRDVHFPYRPDSDFFYLTGFPEPEAVLVLIPGRKQAEYILFNRESDPVKELWDGARAGQEGACEKYAADDSFPIGDLNDILPRMLEQCERIFYVMGCNPKFDKRLSEWINEIRCESRSGVQGPVEIIALDHYLHEMRLYKSRSELKVMRQAARISAKAHKKVMQSCKPGVWEYQLEAEFVRECSHQGSRAQAYPPIVGAGANACTLHYIDNNCQAQAKQMLLIDAGCEYDYYASDITRSYPVNGRFSEPQRQLYELVLAAQDAAIEKVKPGNHWNDPHDAAVRTITRGLIKLGIIKGTLAKSIREEKYKPFFPHRTGHWLGMDVHDVGDYKVDGAWRMLEPGMALTIEPGLYIPTGSKGVAKKWWNIGIRIEDDVVVTKEGCEVLTKDVPKRVAEIESVMAT
ncbi:MAG: Xaa-Pro aminopeptidase [Candidatus Thiodiazotropha lotti]|uniref:Xaa-Pro aminopeptidase n=1 Tax=Candidatus Thiodiazotropha endoloripes TaxID=1818881 RepID=A0A1E2ULP3_9GAMM|nr:Xaa-Pro aminopeptidase [Candidatus Thiodiazotropha endoloripes]MCG7899105.1 Xaa-Pro aminopeptidase [Candidatus Thiodiazotropha weberae]MCG7991878.1 Xaa-Pro aminopeptidase [Candidatus Thiodiazotropha lotti]MCG7901916.1 Xaa-Pro aminopeptidase [Candidatus Thiodiazotropha weberae]MCG7912992.1 Xaa-Pro aminopeptidase [Candidatus Thiodiazotropha weberae]MCG7998382.1 Xaa-Pro aminopeptidase [Candidatus Thiodiazotropha lotti]